MAKRPRYTSPLRRAHDRTIQNEEAMAMLGSHGKQFGRANITQRERAMIRRYNPKHRQSRLEREAMLRLYRKTRKSQMERLAAAKRRK